jgi:PAS domain S-box-containing protein
MNSEVTLAHEVFGSEGGLLRALLESVPDRIFFKDTQSRFVKVNLTTAARFGLKDPADALGKTDFDFMAPDRAREFQEDEQRILQTGEPVVGKIEKQILPDGKVAWSSTTKVPLRDPSGRIVGILGINRDVTEHHRAEEARQHVQDELEHRVQERVAEISQRSGQLAEANAALQQQFGERQRVEQALGRERRLLRTLIDNLPDCIYAKDIEGRKTLANRADLKNLRCKTEADAIGKSDFDLFPPEIAQKFFADDQAVVKTGTPVLNREEFFFDEEGKKHWLLTSKLPLRDDNGDIIGLIGIGRDTTSLKAAEQKLEAAHKKLVEASHQAGMAEVAVGVLHNVGNVLNSVTVAAGVLRQRLRGANIAGLSKLAKLLLEQRDNLVRFLTEDERGRRVPDYVEKLAQHLESERGVMLEELDGLARNIEHINGIVSAQQSFAKVCGVTENVSLSDLVEDAIRIQGGAFERHGIQLLREYGNVPVVSIDKHRVLQIVVNLLTNAKQACDAQNPQEKRVVVRLNTAGESRVRIEVSDNGEGIRPENLPRMFSQGFTTRKEGHGFGLHSGAISARDLGGSLTVNSDGPGRGASFILELPVARASSETSITPRDPAVN